MRDRASSTAIECMIHAVNVFFPAVIRSPAERQGDEKIGLKTHSVVLLHGNL